MSIITAKGKQAAESANKEKGNQIDFKKVFIKLKDGESMKVRLLSAEDYVEYMAHGSYNKGIYTQPCIKPAGEKCALCEASNYEGGEKDAFGKAEWNHLYAKKRYIFAFADLETGELRVFDASKNQAKGLIASIEEYAEDINDVAFTFKRVGTSKDTTYTLNPILKMKGDDKTNFEALNGQEVEMSFYETVLQARTREQQIKELKDAGFPVAEVFGNEADAKDPNAEAAPRSEGEVNPEEAF